MKRKILFALLSLIASIALWLYVITVVSPESQETYYDIPVTYQNDVLEERGLMIVSEKPAVTLRLKGNRTDLNKLSSSNITATIGEYLSPNGKVLATIIAFSPIRLTFSLPLANYPPKMPLNQATLEVVLENGKSVYFENFNLFKKLFLNTLNLLIYIFVRTYTYLW